MNLRPFADSTSVLEGSFAQQADIGWTRQTLILNQSGSWFFLGKLFISLPLPVDNPRPAQCGSCQACMQVCPTNAIIKPYTLDARRCISYRTIEYDGVIPEPLRALISKRIYDCDDCQLMCPWNCPGQQTEEPDFMPRYHLNSHTLLELYTWHEKDFLRYTIGSLIRRIGDKKWIRNISIVLGNASYEYIIIVALSQKLGRDPLWEVHIQWALMQQKIAAPLPQNHKRLLRQLALSCK